MKQLTKHVLPASTTGQASLNVAPGVAVSAPVNGDIWNESGALKIETPSGTKTLATTDQVTGGGSRNIDGGSPDSVYLASQVIDGGNP